MPDEPEAPIMTSTEKDRLDLRQEFERLFTNKRLAEIAMEAMPPIDYAQLATKRDLDAVNAELQGEMAGLRGELRGEMAGLRAELSAEISELRGNFAKLEAKVDGGFATVDGSVAELRGGMSGEFGMVRSEAANNLRLMIASQFTTAALIIGWVSATH